MRLITVALLLLAVMPAAVAAQADSASTPATTVSTPSTTATAPLFHAGQWAGQFTVSGGIYGFGALRHRSPNSAWALNGSIYLTHNTSDPGDYRGNYSNAYLSVGRRVYRAGTGRVRPFRELGLGGGYSWGSNKSGGGGYDSKSQTYSAGVYAQVGAMIFFAPELGLGAIVNANANYSHDHYEYIGAPVPNSNSRDFLALQAGRVSLIGAFYF